MSNCYCLEFSFAKVSEYDLTYTNCSGNTVTETFQSGITYNICSEDFDPITSCLDIDFEIKGFCVNGDCPKGFFKYQNECDVLTIFPLGVECLTQNPTTASSFDGVASLYITGGTPPYIIQWDNGNYSQTLTNLGTGQYTAVVTDFYGDFTANTVCNVIAPSPTPTMTPTPTPTPLPHIPNLCLVLEGRVGYTPYLETFNFSYNGYVNGYPSWTTTPPELDLVWNNVSNQWEILGLTILNPAQLINTNPAIPPYAGWQQIGYNPSMNSLNLLPNGVQLLEGSCSTQNILSFSVTTNNPTCETINQLNICQGDGSIIFNIIDGTPPYSYSIDGINFFPNQPIFSNLCSGNYFPTVLDGAGQTFTQNVTLIQPPPQQLYTVTLFLNQNSSSFNVTVSPQLPVGASISFDIVHAKNLIETPQFGTYTWNNVVTVSKATPPAPSVLIPPTSSILTSQPPIALLNPQECLDISAVIFNSTLTTTWSNVTMVQGDVVTGTISNPAPFTPIVQKCQSQKHSYQLYLDNVQLNNCLCCNVTVVNHPIPEAG